MRFWCICLLLLMFLTCPAYAETEATYKFGNEDTVYNGGTSPLFRPKEPFMITYIMTYHWNEGRGAPGGTIALQGPDGKIYGPWAVTVRSNVYWEARPNVQIPAGNHLVIDSDPATWSQNAQTAGGGHVTITGTYVTATATNSPANGRKAGGLFAKRW